MFVKKSIVHMVALSMFCVAFNLSAQDKTDPAPVFNEEDFVIDRGGAIEVSDSIYKIVAEWNGDLEQNDSLDGYVIETGQLNILRDYMESIKRSGDYVTLSDYLKSTSAEASEKLQLSEALQQKDLEVGLAAQLIDSGGDEFTTWQAEVTGSVDSFNKFVMERHPAAYIEWEESLYIPNEHTSLVDWALETNPEKIDSIKMLLNRIDPVIDGPVKGVPEPSCNCTQIFSYELNPSSFVKPNPNPQKIFDGSRKKLHVWQEDFFGAHYLEMYAYGKRESFQWEKNRENITGIRVTLMCTTSRGSSCAQGCEANMDVFAQYGSEVQVHTDTWSGFLSGGSSESAVMDRGRLVIDAGSSNIEGFDKGVSLTQTTEISFNASNIVNFVADLVQIGFQVYNTISGNQSVTSIDFDLIDEAVQHFQGIVERVNSESVFTKEMLVEYDSIGNFGDQSVHVLPNTGYSAKIYSSGEIVYNGDKRHQSANTYLGSGAGLVVALNNFSCGSDVQTAPQAKACWAHSSTYRSPFHGTQTLQFNIGQFAGHAINGSQAAASSNTGCR